ncbi:alpha/beta fold hydrolase [Ectobacillus polymachus]|uniref:intracellular short-chain-length polyhydroxyalkanoate depolymerase n=1 Tax=Ectobacillus polymachus TaxID=1508806 RepID=UPI003A865EFB
MTLDVSLQTVTLPNGETISYREAGSGKKVIILIHGNMSSSKHWDVVMERLQDSYKLFAIDLRGFGFSSYNEPIESLRDFSEDLLQFVKQVGIRSFSLVGWSTGGGVSMQFASNYPQFVEQLILIESVGIKGYPILKKDELGQPIAGQFLSSKEEIAKDPIQVLPVLKALEKRDKEFYRMLWNHLIYTQNQPNNEKYDEYIEDMFTQRNLVDVDYALVTFNISNETNGVTNGTGEIYQITAPTLVLQGDRDYVVPQAMGEEIANTIQQAKFVLLRNCGHSPLVDCLEELIQHIKAFIS